LVLFANKLGFLRRIALARSESRASKRDLVMAGARDSGAQLTLRVDFIGCRLPVFGAPA
jgi:hypothetical protein